MNIDLSGKNALISGSTQGIGLAVAKELSALGATCTLVARNEESLKTAVAALSTDGGQAHDYIVADFSKPNELESALKGSGAASKTIHVLVNNTGGPPSGPIVEADPEAFRVAFNMHVICNQILTQFVMGGMKEAGYGRIINIISTSVKQPIPGLGVSNTTRGAVANWAKTMSIELGPFGITVNNVLPGGTETERLFALFDKSAERQGISKDEVAKQWLTKIPAGRFAAPEEIAYAVAFLASPSAGYINGINVPVDGGRTGSL